MKKILMLFAFVVAPLFSQAQNTSTILVTTQSHDQYYRYNFGTVTVNFRNSVDFILTAEGPEPTQIRSFSVGGIMYDGSTNCPVVLNPGKSCTFRVSFWPFHEGFFSGQLNIYMATSSIFIDLSGWGRL